MWKKKNIKYNIIIIYYVILFYNLKLLFIYNLIILNKVI